MDENPAATLTATRVSVDELAEFLCDHGLAEEREGYGHATGWQVAEAILSEFVVTTDKDR